MKKSLQFICLSFVILVSVCGIYLSSAFPINTQPYVEKKYAGWSGVLRAWVCSDWSSNGSFIRWLNSCAAEFEKAHEGVYLEFTPVQESVLKALTPGSNLTPDLIFFSSGMITTPDLLMELSDSDALRLDLRSCGRGYALPIAMGGYIWACNTALCESIPVKEDVVLLPQDTPGASYSAALLGLLSAPPEVQGSEPTLPDAGIDLGLPVSADAGSLYSPDALDHFIEGELSFLPVCSADISRLSRLRENGRGPDWKLVPAGNIACTDQLLLGGIPLREKDDGRIDLAEAFLYSLLDEDAQQALSTIGAHSVTGQMVYSDFSAYASLDALLNGLPLWTPDCFSEYSQRNTQAIVRSFLSGDLTAKNALAFLGFEGM